MLLILANISNPLSDRKAWVLRCPYYLTVVSKNLTDFIHAESSNNRSKSAVSRGLKVSALTKMAIGHLLAKCVRRIHA
jgi:hypothetical protein